MVYIGMGVVGYESFGNWFNLLNFQGNVRYPFLGKKGKLSLKRAFAGMGYDDM